MIVSKVLEVLDKAEFRNVALLGRRVLSLGMGCKEIMVLKPSEVEAFDKLMQRNHHIRYINTWVEYIQLLSDWTIEDLNSDHYYKYEDRGWTLDEYDDQYVVDVFIDNYDIEQPFLVEIPKSDISESDLRNLKRKCDRGID